MKNLILYCTIVGLIAIVMAFPNRARAQSLESTMTAYVVQFNDEGRVTYKETESAAPKEEIEYRIVYRNKGDEPLSNLKVDTPIPPNTSYISGSAITDVQSDFLVSIDHGKTWEVEPVVRKITTQDGTIEKLIVQPEEYTHLRWIANEHIGPGKIQEYRYRVIIE